MKNSTVLPFVPNDPQAIRRRFSDQPLSWVPVLAFLPARFFLAFLAEAITAGLLWVQGVPHPWQASWGWWTVYGTLTDIGCLALLIWLTRREGLKISDLLGLRRERLGKQLTYTPGYLLAGFPVIALAYLLTSLFYGSHPAPQVAAIHLPLWAGIYSVVVWPVIWGFTEQVVYLGYLLPRLEVLTKRVWLAAVIVVGCWGMQHFVIPFIPDGKYLLSRCLITTISAGGLTGIFLLWGRRLIPAMLVQYLTDLVTALSTIVLLHR